MYCCISFFEIVPFTFKSQQLAPKEKNATSSTTTLQIDSKPQQHLSYTKLMLWGLQQISGWPRQSFSDIKESCQNSIKIWLIHSHWNILDCLQFSLWPFKMYLNHTNLHWESLKKNSHRKQWERCKGLVALVMA